MSEVLERLRAANAEQAKLYDQLRMWGDVTAQGIDPDDVRAFTVDPKFFPDRRPSIEYYNCWVDHDGNHHKLSPPVKAAER